MSSDITNSELRTHLLTVVKEHSAIVSKEAANRRLRHHANLIAGISVALGMPVSFALSGGFSWPITLALVGILGTLIIHRRTWRTQKIADSYFDLVVVPALLETMRDADPVMMRSLLESLLGDGWERLELEKAVDSCTPLTQDQREKLDILLKWEMSDLRKSYGVSLHKTQYAA